MPSGLSEKEKVVAMLHDVLEDTHMLAVDLRESHYISEEVVESVVVFDGELTGLGDSGIIAAMGDHGHPYNSF